MGNVIATLIAIVISLMIAVPEANQLAETAQAHRAAAAAQQMQTFSAAMAGYVKANYAALAGGTWRLCTNLGTPWGCDYNIQAAGYLPAGFTGTNGYGQSYAGLVTTPSPGNLQAFAVTWGGQQIPEDVAPLAASLQGASGGYWPNGNTHPANTAQGAYGGWKMLYSSQPYNSLYPGPGHLASLSYFANGTMLSPNVLYRGNIPGASPGVNTMNTTLYANVGATRTSEPQIDIYSPTAGAAGIRLHDSTGQGVKLETDSATGNSLELTDAAGNVKQAWRGGNYLSGGQITPNAQNMSAALKGQACAPYGSITSSSDGSGLLQCVGGKWTAIPGSAIDLGTYGMPAATIGTGWAQGGAKPVILSPWNCLPAGHSYRVYATWQSPLRWYEGGRNDFWFDGYVQIFDSYYYDYGDKIADWGMRGRTADWDNGGGPILSGTTGGSRVLYPGGDCISAEVVLGGGVEYLTAYSSTWYNWSSSGSFFYPNYSYLQLTAVPVS